MAKIDGSLETLVRTMESSSSPTHLMLFAGGALVSGVVCSQERYAEAFVDSLNLTGVTPGEVRPLATRLAQRDADEYIYLDAATFGVGGTRVKVHNRVWRIRLEDVTGWAIGSLDDAG
jgi:hypothetical protein